MSRNRNAIYYLAARNLKRSRRNPMIVTFTMIQPLLWVLLYSQSFRQIGDFTQFTRLGFTSYITFLTPGIMALTVLQASIQSGISIVTDIDTGMMDKLLINPIRRSSILLGRVLADAATIVVECIIVLAVAFALGAHSATGFGGVVTVLVITVLLGVCASAFSDSVALRTRNAQVTMIVGMISALPLLFLSPAFFPRQLQPGWLRAVGMVNPVAYVVTSGQNLMNLGVDWGQLLATVGVLALAGTLCFGSAIRAFQRAVSGSGKTPGPIKRWVMLRMADLLARRRLPLSAAATQSPTTR
jgi:ABC-2 type transport system permease protein